MLGLMQDWPLLIHRVIDYAALQHSARPVISRSVEGPMHRTDYATIRQRALRLSKRLTADGIGLGDRVATLAWNTWRHLEAWYGITGVGAIYHTVNPRLFEEQIAYIVNHAEDRILLLDLTFLPLVERLADKLPTIERYVVLTDGAHMPPTSLRNAVAYEDWLAEADDDFAWATFDENTAAGLCYTSGTTGLPKGVLYSHRSNVLLALTVNNPAYIALSPNDMAMPVVPLFHANAWGFTFAAPMSGAGLVMPGPKLDGASVLDILESTGVTVTAAVPTVWLGLLQHLDATGSRLTHLKRVVIGGSACPRAMTERFERDFGVTVDHAWGMTEMSPIGSYCSLKPEVAHLQGEARLDLKMKQGYAPFGVEFRLTDDDNRDLPWDGTTFGRLKVAGFAVAKAYFRSDEPILDDRGFFDTGDVATIDEHGYMAITDRSKDVIKSGGEWISSIDLENLAVGHPDVAEAAVIGVQHPKWDERPLLIVVPKEGRTPDKADILAFMAPRIAKWWMPDDVVVVHAIPHTATGKIQKTALRDQFRDYRLPGAA
ncbi:MULTISPECIES: long-chain-fatty-acid--CoA ligase [Methylobacterium]|jgi:acyl-CoA synthetase (AMP-forming)/AMP-acid ligase II|uniref:long-chain-fatty-acid--CoA ligase n=1 Tax=Methylobacterium TaxID=407 RepID=UPI0008F38AB4|nr:MULTISPECIES: long-chain-fatty-acid--CoA ligase [Methylobacterium]MBZ6415312.1 long-chain-fatty-acid--CoA ligase [Methylobacterium sp.]MBK3396147.1 long-chain-fatty-acid--CoA ligase [Methylobacterium ajmalii]MBK3406811.1 long-chain-fatty-acid--CoA ligase [Methylobacterium ajmalii]MBK3425525.1 long-chain-fatty-acid--CoA ligase [Methylobacterium ajmalii]SFE81093.1 fatty-acyl-CoA synthase [Methylobacterium sp. yr596]